jgi:hypothetical protein
MASKFSQGGRCSVLILTFSPAFLMILTMKTMFQTDLIGQVPEPPEKRFLINWHRQKS